MSDTDIDFITLKGNIVLLCQAYLSIVTFTETFSGRMDTDQRFLISGFLDSHIQT